MRIATIGKASKTLHIFEGISSGILVHLIFMHYEVGAKHPTKSVQALVNNHIMDASPLRAAGICDVRFIRTIKYLFIYPKDLTMKFRLKFA
jgi:hypothetical protein